MKIAVRLTVALTAVFCLVLAARGWLDTRDTRNLVESELREEQDKLADTLALGFVEAWRTRGLDAATEWLERVNERRAVTEVRLVCPEGTAAGCTAGRADGAEPTSVSPSEHARQKIIGAGADAVLVTRLPIAAGGDPDVILELERSLAPESGYVRDTLRREALTALVVIALVALAVWLLSRWMIARPVEVLIEHAERVAGGDVAPPPTEVGVGAPAVLASKITEVAEQLQDVREEVASERSAREETEQQLRHANRLGSVGTLAAGLVHDLGSPLNVIAGRASMIEAEAPAEGELRANARIIREQATRISTMIRQLLSFSRRNGHGGEANVSWPRQAAQEHFDLVEPLARRNKVETVLRGEEDVALAIEPTALRQVLNNLMVNAIQAMPDGGELGVGTGRRNGDAGTRGGSGPYGYFYVEDTGAGIPPEREDRLFEPFYTTKGATEGSGLGLTVCDRIVREHHGWIEVESTPGQGSRFTVFLPETRSET